MSRPDLKVIIESLLYLHRLYTFEEQTDGPRKGQQTRGIYRITTANREFADEFHSQMTCLYRSTME